MEGIPFDISMN